MTFLVEHFASFEQQLVEAESPTAACRMMAWRPEDCQVRETDSKGKEKLPQPRRKLEAA